MKATDFEKKIYDIFSIKREFVANYDMRANQETEKEADEHIAKNKEELIKKTKSERLTEEELSEKIKFIEDAYNLIKDKRSREELKMKLLIYVYSHRQHPGTVELDRNAKMQEMGGSQLYSQYGYTTVTRLGKVEYIEKSVAPNLVPDMANHFYVYKVDYRVNGKPKTVVISTPEDLIEPPKDKKKYIESKLLSTELLEASQLPSNSTYIGTVSNDGKLSLEQKTLPTSEQMAHQAVIDYQKLVATRNEQQGEEFDREEKYGHVPDYSLVGGKDAIKDEKWQVLKEQIPRTRSFGEEKKVTRLGMVKYGEEGIVYAYTVECNIGGRKQKYTIYTTEDLIDINHDEDYDEDPEKEDTIKNKLLSEEVILASQLPSNGGFIGKVMPNGKLSLSSKDFFGDFREKRAFALFKEYSRIKEQAEHDKQINKLFNDRDKDMIGDIKVKRFPREQEI